VRLYLSTNKYEPTDTLVLPFPADITDHDFKAVKSHLEELESSPVQEGSSRTYGELINDSVNRYLEAFRSIPPGTKDSSTGLVGFELIDILDAAEDQKVAARLLPLSNQIQQWKVLVKNQNVVFARGLGDVIEAVRTAEGCRECSLSAIPRQDFLVCPVYLLQEILLKTSCSLYWHFVEKKGNDGFKWIFKGDPFQCTWKGKSKEHDCWKGRLQQIRPTGHKWLSFRKKLPMIEVKTLPYEKSGAICFGQYVRFKVDS